jgi:hypothetical protein
MFHDNAHCPVAASWPSQARCSGDVAQARHKQAHAAKAVKTTPPRATHAALATLTKLDAVVVHSAQVGCGARLGHRPASSKAQWPTQRLAVRAHGPAREARAVQGSRTSGHMSGHAGRRIGVCDQQGTGDCCRTCLLRRVHMQVVPAQLMQISAARQHVPASYSCGANALKAPRRQHLPSTVIPRVCCASSLQVSSRLKGIILTAPPALAECGLAARVTCSLSAAQTPHPHTSSSQGCNGTQGSRRQRQQETGSASATARHNSSGTFPHGGISS